MIFLSTESDSLGITSCLPVIRPESKAKDEITFYWPTSHYQSDVDAFAYFDLRYLSPECENHWGVTSLDFGCRFGGIVLIGVVRTQRQPRSHSRGTIPDYTSTTSHSVVLDYVHFFDRTFWRVRKLTLSLTK